MLSDYELELEKLYIELREKAAEEMRYLAGNKEIDDKYIAALVMDKRIITDKIEKKGEKDKISNVAKIRIQAVIKVIMEMEEENRKMYADKLENIKKELINLEKERKLKKKYLTAGDTSLLFDKKK